MVGLVLVWLWVAGGLVLERLWGDDGGDGAEGVAVDRGKKGEVKFEEEKREGQEGREKRKTFWWCLGKFDGV